MAVVQKITHVSVYVEDQDEALDFYVGKLGMELRTDQTMPGGFRWLTVAPKGQDMEIVLMKLGSGPNLSEEDVAAIRGLMKRGAFGAGVLKTDDCYKAYDELTKKGVEFSSPPTEQFYSVEAIMKDPFGNWFSLGSDPKKPA